jgi:hypothetical protein
MQTIDSYVIYSTMDAPRPPTRKRALRLAVFLSVAFAVAAGLASFWRAGDLSTPAARPKAEARVVAESPASLRSDDEARIAAFQQAAAISHLTLAPTAVGADGAKPVGPLSRPADRLPRKPAQKPAPRSVMVAAPVPQSRPLAPEVIMADLPPAPQVEPAPAEGKPHLLGTIAQDVERVPSEVQDFASGMTDRALDALGNVRARIGL